MRNAYARFEPSAVTMPSTSPQRLNRAPPEFARAGGAGVKDHFVRGEPLPKNCVSAASIWHSSTGQPTICGIAETDTGGVAQPPPQPASHALGREACGERGTKHGKVEAGRARAWCRAMRATSCRWRPLRASAPLPGCRAGALPSIRRGARWRPRYHDR